MKLEYSNKPTMLAISNITMLLNTVRATCILSFLNNGIRNHLEFCDLINKNINISITNFSSLTTHEEQYISLFKRLINISNLEVKTHESHGKINS